MTKDELKFLLSKGFTISELLEIEGGGIPRQPEPSQSPEPQPEPGTKPSGSDTEKPETAQKTPDPTGSVSKPDTEPDPSAEKIAALEAQIEKLQAQILRTGTNQPGGKDETLEDLVAAF